LEIFELNSVEVSQSELFVLSNPERAPAPHAVRAAAPLGPDAEVGLPRGEPGAAFLKDRMATREGGSE
jgi:hypothetical protein